MHVGDDGASCSSRRRLFGVCGSREPASAGNIHILLVHEWMHGSVACCKLKIWCLRRLMLGCVISQLPNTLSSRPTSQIGCLLQVCVCVCVFRSTFTRVNSLWFACMHACTINPLLAVHQPTLKEGEDQPLVQGAHNIINHLKEHVCE